MSVLPENLSAQWKRIFDAYQTSGNSFGISVVSFKEFDSIPLEGFVSASRGGGGGLRTDKFWRTIDGGITWQQLSDPLSHTGRYADPDCFTFKDKMEGWFNEFGGDVFRTIDGGMTWNLILSNNFGKVGSLLYLPSTKRLLLAFLDTPSYYYSTDGINFIPGSVPGTQRSVGIAFSDGLHGILTSVGTPFDKVHFTSDGGLTWNESQQTSEEYQPMAIKGTTTFYAICEAQTNAGRIFRSDDGGNTWKNTYKYPKAGATVTGTIQYNSSGIFFQTAGDSTEGIMMSDDSAKTFFSLCGPVNANDTRFYVRDSFIYAGDRLGGLWMNTTGIGSNSTPELSSVMPILIHTLSCTPRDTVITFTFFDSCNGHQAKLVDASIPGSTNFSLPPPFNAPRTIHPNDSLIVHYDPSASLSDSGLLHLRFHLGWKDFDTTIRLIGSSSVRSTAELSVSSLALKPSTCSASDSVIILSFFDSCTGTNAVLDSAVLSGSGNFSLLTPNIFPHSLHASDSLMLRYDSHLAGKDTAKLRLHFHLGSKGNDTTILLYGVRKSFVKSDISLTTLEFQAQGCSNPDSLITISYFDSCSGLQGTLLSASISDPADFTLLSPTTFPHIIVPNDSLRISYHPQGPGKDIAAILLHFQLGDEFLDTAIALFGSGRLPPENIKFISSLSNNSATVGSVVDLFIKPDKAISGRGLDSISFSIIYNADLLNSVGSAVGTGIPGALISVGAEQPSPSVPQTEYREREVVIRGANLSLDPALPVLDLKFQAMVTKASSTSITINNLKLNGGDPDYANCVLSADTTGANFSEIYICGDS
ncbi:MAG: hypothetical protein ABI778_11105, partial [Ignavibacteriota bacterium]